MLPPEEHLRLLKDRAAGIPARQDALNRSRALRGTRPGFDRTAWQAMCAKGWVGLCLPDPQRGPGAGMRALCRAAETMGIALAPEPLVAAAMAAALLPPAHRAAVLAGARIVLPAWQEAPGSLDLHGTMRRHDGCLTGRKLNVAMAEGADAFLVTLPDGAALVARGAPGLTLATRDTPDGGHVATLDCAATPAEAWSDQPATAPGQAMTAVALDQAMTATAAYLLGLMDGAMAALAAVSQGDSGEVAERFRADLRTQVALARSAVQAGVTAWDGPHRGVARQAAISRAMLRVADAAVVVTQGCVRLARGRPDSDLDLYRCKAAVLAGTYGAAAVHRARAGQPTPPPARGEA